MYAIGKPHPFKQPCVALLHRIEAGAIQVVTSVEILQELLHRYHSLRAYEVAAFTFANTKTLCERILPVLEADLDRAYQMLKDLPLINVRDAIHAATMLNNDLREIISTDTHFDAIPGIVRVDPVQLSRRGGSHTRHP